MDPLLKLELMEGGDGVCGCGCGQPLRLPELHHGIITKAMARGLKGVKVKRLLDHPVNCFLVNHECHQNPPPPLYFWQIACDQHGVGIVRKWYSQMQGLFKTDLEDLE